MTGVAGRGTLDRVTSETRAAPELETERLRLRMLRESDFPVYERWCADPDMVRYLGYEPMNRVQAWRHLAFLVGHWALRGFGYYGLEEKATGTLVGRAGFTQPAGWPGFELGWSVAPEHQRRGFATEAALRLRDHAFADLGRSHLISLIHPDNAPSRRVADRIGETVEGETEVLGMTMLVYGIGRDADGGKFA